MVIDAAKKAVRSLTKSYMKYYSNKLRNSRSLQACDHGGSLPRKESPDVARPPRKKTTKQILMAELEKNEGNREGYKENK